MAEIKLHLPDDLEQAFRKAAMATYGYGRGSLSKAAIQAITEWCNQHQTSRSPQDVTNPKEERPTVDLEDETAREAQSTKLGEAASAT